MAIRRLHIVQMLQVRSPHRAQSTVQLPSECFWSGAGDGFVAVRRPMAICWSVSLTYSIGFLIASFRGSFTVSRVSGVCSRIPGSYKVRAIVRVRVGNFVFGSISTVDTIFKYACVCVCVCVFPGDNCGTRRIRYIL